MANIFWKNLHLCFPSKLKIPESESLIPPIPNPNSHPKKNFSSLYNISFSSASTSKYLITNSTDFLFDFDTESPPDFATIFASQRFFFSSPGCSNSIVESPDTKPRDSIEIPPLNGGVPVRKFSPDLCRDFHISMQEMIESRNETDWEFLHELLISYLSLNPKQNHKFIINAFSDILISLFSSLDSVSSWPQEVEIQ